MSADPKELSALGAPVALLWVLYLEDLFKFERNCATHTLRALRTPMQTTSINHNGREH